MHYVQRCSSKSLVKIRSLPRRKLYQLNEVSSFFAWFKIVSAWFSNAMCPGKTVIKAKPFKTCSFGEGKRVEDEPHTIKGPTYCLGKGSKRKGGHLGPNRVFVRTVKWSCGLVEVAVCARGLPG